MDLIPLQIRDVAEARRFYQEVLGCLEGPEVDQRLDFSLHGHQILCRFNPQLGKQGRVVSQYHLMNGQYVPIAHSRVVLKMSEWRSLAKRIKLHRVKVAIEPHHYAPAGVKETLLLLDPSGNALEVQSVCTAEESLRGDGMKALARWMPWAVLTASIVCYLLLLPDKAQDEIAAEYFAAVAHTPACASVGAVSCVP